MARRKKERSPPGSPSYSSVLKAVRSSTEASECEDDEMSDAAGHDGLPPDPCAPPPDPLLTYEQVLQWWEEEYVPVLQSKGWSRTQIDQGYRSYTRKEDGRRVTSNLTYPRPKRAGGMKTKAEWFRLAGA